MTNQLFFFFEFLAESRLFTLALKLGENNKLEFYPQLHNFQEVLNESIIEVIKILLRPQLLCKGDLDAAHFLRVIIVKISFF